MKEFCGVRKASLQKDDILDDSIYIAFLRRPREMENRLVVMEMENRLRMGTGREVGMVIKGQREGPSW